MKPQQLIMSAFGSYAGRTEINFEKQQGIFLITGDTGAGKTTIFDGIIYALYGQTSGGERSGNMMRSQYAAPSAQTYVELVFQYKGESYRIHRNPEYQIEKKLKNGTIKLQKAAAGVELIMPDGTIFPEKKNLPPWCCWNGGRKQQSKLSRWRGSAGSRSRWCAASTSSCARTWTNIGCSFRMRRPLPCSRPPLPAITSCCVHSWQDQCGHIAKAILKPNSLPKLC